jgi:Zn-finger nucleic acid-binding protein
MTAPALIPAPMALRCPKCAAEMVTYERSGIHLDQCRECRGIYLDRGELERLVDAESGGAGWAGPRMNPPAPVPLPRAADPRFEARPQARPMDTRGYLPEWFGDGDHDGRSSHRDDRDDRDDWDDGRGRDGRDGRDRPQKRGGFLGELLEGFGD